ncbi:MAG: dTDP-glucose 4,6-dehydratase [Planctomycetota bacterium]
MTSSRRILVTGGCGFIGSHVVRRLLRDTQHTVTNLDKLTYAGNPANLRDVENDPRYTFVQGCITDQTLVASLICESNAILHLAAETHVDRSIGDAAPFMQTNVVGTQTLLDALRHAPDGTSKPFVQVSTDEVFGDLPIDRPDLRFNEESPVRPRSPYAASKAAGDLLGIAYHTTFGLDVRVTNGSNAYGPNQFPEKLIPSFITRLIDGKSVPLYGDGLNIRDWLHVEDHASAILAVLDHGRSGRRYCIGGQHERSNLTLTRDLLAIMGRDETAIEYVADRPGHDRRYALDHARLRDELGWSPTHTDWQASLTATVRWYEDHPQWWRPLLQQSC